MLKNLRDSMGDMNSVGYSDKSEGVFNALTAQVLQSGSVAERTAKAAEKTAKNTDKLDDIPRDLRAVGAFA